MRRSDRIVGYVKMEKESKNGFFRVLHKEGKLIPLALVAALGIALLIIAGLFDGEETKNTAAHDSQGVIADVSVSGESYFVSYEAELEEKIRLLCAEVGGVGQVRVSVYISEMLDYVDGSEASDAYLTLYAPKISGVGIVCDGGNDPNVKKELTMLISTAFSVGSNKIYITGT